MADIKDISWPEPMANRLRVANDRIAELEQQKQTAYDELELQVKKCQRLRGALESIQTNPDYTAPEYMVRIARKALEE